MEGDGIEVEVNINLVAMVGAGDQEAFKDSGRGHVDEEDMMIHFGEGVGKLGSDVARAGNRKLWSELGRRGSSLDWAKEMRKFVVVFADDNSRPQQDRQKVPEERCDREQSMGNAGRGKATTQLNRVGSMHCFSRAGALVTGCKSVGCPTLKFCMRQVH